MATDLSTFNNSDYRPGNAIVRMLWFVVNWIFFRSAFPFSSVKVRLLRLFGARVGKGVVIKPFVNIKYPWKLSVGNYVWIGEEVWIDNLDWVRIGDHCCLSQGAMLLCGNHNYQLPSFDLITAPITLEEGVWIAAKALVCPGVICHSHSILSVQSTTSQHLDAYTIYRGNPAVAIKKRKFTR